MADLTIKERLTRLLTVMEQTQGEDSEYAKDVKMALYELNRLGTAASALKQIHDITIGIREELAEHVHYIGDIILGHPINEITAVEEPDFRSRREKILLQTKTFKKNNGKMRMSRILPTCRLSYTWEWKERIKCS